MIIRAFCEQRKNCLHGPVEQMIEVKVKSVRADWRNRPAHYESAPHHDHRPGYMLHLAKGVFLPHM